MTTSASMYEPALIALIASFAASILVVLTKRWHGRLSMDLDVSSIQKFHKSPVPRIGGITLVIGIFSAFLAGTGGSSPASVRNEAGDVFWLLLAAMPAFLAGFVEDLTKKVSVRMRLMATFASALLAYWLLGACLPRLDIWGIDEVLRFAPLAMVVTAVAVAGVANSINIIDGFHGVAGGAAGLILAGLGYLAWQGGDMFVARLALIGIGASAGFLLVNYPTGKLFMGDGGAYFLGFWIAEVAVLLVMRNPAVSAWQVLAVCVYPVTEVLYSIYRRTFIRQVSPGSPDRLHLHTLIYRRIACRLVPRSVRQPWVRNAVVAWFVGTWIAVVTFTAVTIAASTPVALTVVGVNTVLYMAVYARLVRGKWQLFRPRRSSMDVHAHAHALSRFQVRKSR